MKTNTFNWYESDGKKVFARVWQPDNTLNLKGTISIIHGLGEHSGRYEHVAAHFVSKNFAVLACDLRGHGNSEGQKGHVSGYSTFYDQIDSLLESSSKRFSGEPKFLFGHSMGGNIVASYALKRKPRIMGFIVSAPWIYPGVEVPQSKITMAKIANKVWSSYSESNNLDPNHISRTEQVVQDYIDDPLVHDKISVRLFLKGTANAKFILKNASKLRLPMLLMHGTADAITKPEGSAEFAAKNPDYITYKEWEGLYHELHNEPEQQEVFNVMQSWMETKLDKATQLGRPT